MVSIMDTALTTINLKKETKMSIVTNNQTTSSKMTCFKIQRSVPNAFAHNDRSQTVDHAYPQFSHLNEVDASAFLAEEKYLCMLTQAIQNYIARTGQRVQVDPKKHQTLGHSTDRRSPYHRRCQTALRCNREKIRMAHDTNRYPQG